MLALAFSEFEVNIEDITVEEREGLHCITMFQIFV